MEARADLEAVIRLYWPEIDAPGITGEVLALIEAARQHAAQARETE